MEIPWISAPKFYLMKDHSHYMKPFNFYFNEVGNLHTDVKLELFNGNAVFGARLLNRKRKKAFDYYKFLWEIREI